MEYENTQNGIFQKNTITTKILVFLEYGIFQEYSKNIPSHANFVILWNIEYSRIFQKKCITTKILIFLEYEILRNISEKKFSNKKYKPF